MRFSPWSISQQSQSGNFHPKHNIWRTETPVNPRKMEFYCENLSISNLYSNSMDTNRPTTDCTFQTCQTSFAEIRKIAFEQITPRKTNISRSSENAGKGRQAFSFEMVPFQLTYQFSGRDTLCVYTPEN